MELESNPQYFKTPNEFREWLTHNYQESSELWVGYFKKDSGIQSITWPESVDQALCFGWIDGIRKSIDNKRYMIRFTPRKPRSHWSNVNIRKVKELKKLKLMTPAGLLAYKKRDEKKSRQASFEQKQVLLRKDFEKILKGSDKAWSYYNLQSPSYQKQVIWWIMSAKKEETRVKRLNILIESSEKHEVIPPMKWSK